MQPYAKLMQTYAKLTSKPWALQKWYRNRRYAWKSLILTFHWSKSHWLIMNCTMYVSLQLTLCNLMQPYANLCKLMQSSHKGRRPCLGQERMQKAAVVRAGKAWFYHFSAVSDVSLQLTLCNLMQSLCNLMQPHANLCRAHTKAVDPVQPMKTC